MAEDEKYVIRLRTDFYRDGFSKVLIALVLVVVAIILLVTLSFYIHFTKPSPVYFATDNEWRILPPIPEDKPYLSDADLLQWFSHAIQAAFSYDFLNYKKELQDVSQYFTTSGWKILLNQLNSYANYNAVVNAKSFLTASITAAPVFISRGLVDGRFAWWIQAPLVLKPVSIGGGGPPSKSIIVQAFIVRVPTLNNINGVGIENLIITEGTAIQVNQVNTNAQ